MALQHFLDAQITHHAKAVELLSNASKTLRDIDLDSDIDLILDRINLAASRPSSPINNNTFDQISQFSRSSASPMKSPLKSANGLYSPGSPTIMKLTGNNMFKTGGSPSHGSMASPFTGRSPLKMKDDSYYEESNGRSRRDSKVSNRRTRSTVR